MEFNKEDLVFIKPFKGLSVKYIIDAIFDDNIQKNWIPKVGDIIVGETGNIFVISAIENTHKSLGRTTYYFGGGSCTSGDSCVLDSTYCYTANESGKYIHPLKGETVNFYHSSIRDFKYVPYPHEL